MTMTNHTTPVFTATATMTFSVPAVGSYDWNNYAKAAYDAGDLSADEMDTIDGAWAVVEAMARDYLKRGDSCTAAHYLMSGEYVMPAPQQSGVVSVIDPSLDRGQLSADRTRYEPTVVNPSNDEIQASIDGDGPWY